MLAQLSLTDILTYVSIRTRPEGRVMQRRKPLFRRFQPSFNPHPARGPGDALC